MSVNVHIKKKIVTPKLCIGFTGSQGSGKTTMSNYVINTYNFKHTYNNQTRDLIKKDYNNDLAQARKDNYNFQQKLLKKRLLWEKRHQKTGFVTDRTTLDNIAYFLTYTNVEYEQHEESLNYLLKGMTNAQKSYDLIFCLSPLRIDNKDPLSPDDFKEKLKLYYVILGLLNELSYNLKGTIVYVNTIDITERKAIIKNTILPYL